MRISRTARALALLPLTAAVLLLAAGPTNAATPAADTAANQSMAGTIKLTVTAGEPIFGEDDTLVYNFHVTNAGPAIATGVVLHVSSWYCSTATWSASTCYLLHRRIITNTVISYDVDLEAIVPLAGDFFPVTTHIPDEPSGYVRTTVNVTKSDQTDSASTPGTCNNGLSPALNCASKVVAFAF